MDIRITGARLSGSVPAPPSKSAGHRLLLGAALAEGTSVLHGMAPSQDILATIDAARALGAKIETEECPGGFTARVTGPLRASLGAECPCRESGSTERFFLPVAAALGGETTFTGTGRLPERPLGPLAGALQTHGARLSRCDGMPFTVEGPVTPGVYELPGDVSSQYITGLLFALPLLGEESEIALTTPLQSAGYVDLTVRTLARFGVRVSRTARGYTVPGRQTYRPLEADVEGDWSGGAFWLAAAFLGAHVRVAGLDRGSAQGDRAAADILRAFEGAGEARVDCADIPDLVPPLAIAAAGRKGVTRFVGAGRLRLKESDRIASVCACIEALGGRARAWEDGFAVSGNGSLRGGTADAQGDHRIAMAAAVAAVICEEPVVILGAQAVEKSYPDFFTRFRELGGKFDVL